MTTRQIAAFAVLFLVAAVLLSIGVCTHSEPTFAVPLNSWGHVPLTVRCADDPSCDIARTQVDKVNGRLGFDMLAYVDTPAADIDITINVPASASEWVDRGGNFTLTGSDTTYHRCTVVTSNTGTDELLAMVLHHELGHCLGLAHDDFTASIMYPEQSAVASGQYPPRMTDADRDALRERYR